MRDSLRISSFHKNHNISFSNKLKALCKLYRIPLVPVGGYVRRQKNTILRSPHGHKSARDQIEVQHHISFFKVKPNFLWLQFITNLPDVSLGLEYSHNYKQRVYLKK